MVDKGAEYTVRDFSAVDTQVAEMAKREKLLTWRLRIENLKRLGIPLILFATAAAIIILAIGIFLWLIKKEKIVEIGLNKKPLTKFLQNEWRIGLIKA